MRLAIVGSRSFVDYNHMKEVVDNFQTRSFFPETIDKIISGGAQGADSLGVKYARENNIETVIIKPDWKKFGKSAGFKRNKLIVDACDCLIAFWNGNSKGTQNTIDIANKQHKKVIIKTF